MMNTFLSTFFKGIIVGIANIIPGVSGGTIAVVLGIFDRLISAVNNLRSDWKKHLPFLLPLLLGALFGIGAFSKVIEFSLANYSLPTTMFFAGLVIGSVPLIYKKASSEKFKPIYLLPLAIAILVVVIMVHAKAPVARDAVIVVSPALMLKMFFGGIIASAAMVVPGISGSFVMLLLGMYETVLKSISSFISAFFSFNIDELISPTLLLIPLGIGVILGIVLVAKVIDILLKKAYSLTYYAILGLILGSIYGLFADPNTYASGINTVSVISAVITCLIGISLSFFLGKDE